MLLDNITTGKNRRWHQAIWPQDGVHKYTTPIPAEAFGDVVGD